MEKFLFFYYRVKWSIRKILLLERQVTELMYSSSVLSDKVKVALLYIMTVAVNTNEDSGKESDTCKGHVNWWVTSLESSDTE